VLVRIWRNWTLVYFCWECKMVPRYVSVWQLLKKLNRLGWWHTYNPSTWLKLEDLKFEASLGYTVKKCLQTEIPYDSVKSTPRYSPKRIKNIYPTETCKWMFTQSLFTSQKMVLVVVVHTCNPSTLKVQAVRSLSLRPVWATKQDPISKNKNSFYIKTGSKVKTHRKLF
jgi:hypothetical protein